MATHYETLGLKQDATAEQIKLAYRKLSKQHHPDVSGGSKESEKIFLDVQEAYKVLKDPTLKEAYDVKLANGGPSFSQQRASETGKPKAEWQQADLNMDNIQKNFEQFFGFNPRTKEVSSSLQNKKNPLDTTELFERFFRK
ncbi:DnaJ domain-containing protein [Metasolibacillus meyeri]|uniref:DnaJ domain-containing protein n=1 Tax=Metasolibacillus meyeri TaxID=1071052 RepID=A0AAW9NUF6_9BACL|nr:DnaJ domain-containing protein [Metasolibacillus meyeri]MEC1180042.1 DnaJ domain-containing protein [Metasolibacillus meyeri]